MRVRPLEGSIFDAVVDVRVNPIGHGPKGLSRQFNKKEPTNHQMYEAAMMRENFEPGVVYPTVNPTGGSIFNMLYWADQYQMEDAISDLALEMEWLKDDGYPAKSIAIPKLGKGDEWTTIRPLILNAFSGMDVDIYLED